MNGQNLLIAATCSLLLAGCAGNCPALKDYSTTEQQAIAKAHNALPDDSPLLSPLQDWERMRRACR